MDRVLAMILIVVLLLLLLGLLPTWPYAAGWGLGYYPSGAAGVLIVIIIVIAIFRSGPRDKWP